MLSRRSVRIKVMQALYALNTDEKLTLAQAKKSYWQSIERSYELLLFNLYAIQEITRVAMDDAAKRETKHLPSDYDKAFTPKLFQNELIQSLVTNDILRKRYEKLNFSSKIDRDYFKKVYSKFSKEDEHKKFIIQEDYKALDILLELYRFCRSDEFFNEILEDAYFTWQDDKSLVVGSVKKVLKSLPQERDMFFEDFYPDDETVKEYGEALLETTFEEDKVLLELIKPLLKNWDHDRLALIDTMLIKMAITEMLRFETIPTKVTLNEYVEVSKLYSTPKSKDFINGILDKVLKDLTEAGKIAKSGRGLID